jgi:hypothetical protein
MRVFVYFNLHKKVWSVKALEGEARGRVILHARELCLEDCAFKVSEAGRQRVLRERCKNVHAGVVGTLRDTLPAPVSCVRRITYDPYRFSSFVDAASLAPLSHAPWARFCAQGVFIP